MEQAEVGSRSVLQHLWKVQRDFNQKCIAFESPDKTETELTKEYVLGLVSELDELMRELAWKTHRKDESLINKSNLLEELIDIFKYWLSIVTIWGFTPEDIIEGFNRKSAVVEQRFNQEMKLNLKEVSKIAGIDIDGVLAHEFFGFVDWLNKTYGMDCVPVIDEQMIHNRLGLDLRIYMDLKDKFRQSGQIKNLPVMHGARELLFNLKRAGYTIVLLSARPIKQYKRLESDTKEWLNVNGLLHDCILYDAEKNRRLLQTTEPGKIAFFIEDDLQQANDIAQLGIKVYLLNYPYNQGETDKNVIRVNSLKKVESEALGGGSKECQK